MAEITRLHGSPHEQTQRLLPWYNNGTLDSGEAALVQAHLAECAECRADAEFDRQIAGGVASLKLDVEHGWAALNETIGTASSTGGSRAAETSQIVRPPFWRRRVPIAWMVTGQAAAALLVFAAFALPASSPEPAAYHALGAAPVSEAGNLVVVFDPEASEAQMRGALAETGARIVDGPNASGAYVLHVAEDGRPSALRKLRSKGEILLAEPIGSGGSS